MLYSVDEICRIRYGCEKPTQAQRNTITHMCQTGSVKAHKFGRTWLIQVGDEDSLFDYDKLAEIVVDKLMARMRTRRKVESE